MRHPALAQQAAADLEHLQQPLVGEIARKLCEEVAGDVIPDLAEAMIRREIERIRKETGQD